MRQSLTLATYCAGLVAAHGHVRDYTVDGNTYPAFDPQHDFKPQNNAKRIEWGFNQPKGGVGPVENVNGPDIACRFQPLKEPAISAEVRAGANITFKWLDWFGNHKGPVLTYMGELPASGKVADTEFFKIDEASYDPKTQQWGIDWLVKNSNSHTSTIPSDIKPGNYVVRHEIISLHNALNDDFVKKQSGAQFYPQCIKLKVTGEGTATPKGTKFPGLYKWDDKGILINLYWRPNEYLAPGGPVYKPTTALPVKGAKPVVTERGVLENQLPAEYRSARAKTDRSWENAVHADVAKHPGGGGCIWEPGSDPKKAKCTPTNPNDPKYKGLGQPPQSPMYVDESYSNRAKIGRGPVVKYLFDPTQPRAEERVAKGLSASGMSAPGRAAAKGKMARGGRVAATLEE